jgi:hypothetical protein
MGYKPTISNDFSVFFCWDSSRLFVGIEQWRIGIWLELRYWACLIYIYNAYIYIRQHPEIAILVDFRGTPFSDNPILLCMNQIKELKHYIRFLLADFMKQYK